MELLHRTTHEFELTEAGRFLLERGPALLAALTVLLGSLVLFLCAPARSAGPRTAP